MVDRYKQHIVLFKIFYPLVIKT